MQMTFQYFSHNGEVLPTEQAVVPLGRVEYSYGFGVYENIRAIKARALFLDAHCHRLMKSAEIIGLEHNFTPQIVENAVVELVKANQIDTCNVKILLIGGPSKDSASLEILCLNPLFPDRQLYKTGAKAITYEYEREYPQAKTLNMLSSYLAYKKAVAAGAYDALLINRQRCITEGTRTNFFGMNGRTIISPPEAEILLGVTRDHMLKVARENRFEVVEQPIKLSEINQLPAAFLTSTSAKIMPLQQIDNQTFEITAELNELMRAFTAFLETQ
jgi:branched-chain amino acid aminotransferase